MELLPVMFPPNLESFHPVGQRESTELHVAETTTFAMPCAMSWTLNSDPAHPDAPDSQPWEGISEGLAEKRSCEKTAVTH